MLRRASGRLDARSHDSFDLTDEDTAETLMPLIVEYIETSEVGAVIPYALSMLNREFSRPYLSRLLAVYPSKPEETHCHFTWDLSKLITRQDYDLVWDAIRSRVYLPMDACLLTALVRVAPKRREAVEMIKRRLAAPELTRDEAALFAEVRLAEIRDYILELTGAESAALREIRRRALRKKLPPPPAHLRMIRRTFLDTGKELYSTEIDLEQLPALLERLVAEYSIHPHTQEEMDALVYHLAFHQFVALAGTSAPARLWLRAEDGDVAHVMVTSVPGARRAKS